MPWVTVASGVSNSIFKDSRLCILLTYHYLGCGEMILFRTLKIQIGLEDLQLSDPEILVRHSSNHLCGSPLMFRLSLKGGEQMEFHYLLDGCWSVYQVTAQN